MGAACLIVLRAYFLFCTQGPLLMGSETMWDPKITSVCKANTLSSVLSLWLLKSFLYTVLFVSGEMYEKFGDILFSQSFHSLFKSHITFMKFSISVTCSYYWEIHFAYFTPPFFYNLFVLSMTNLFSASVYTGEIFFYSFLLKDH